MSAQLGGAQLGNLILADRGSQSFSLEPISAGWSAPDLVLAATGAVVRLLAPLTAPWQIGSFGPTPIGLVSLDAQWVMGQCQLRSAQNYTVTDVFLPGDGGLFGIPAETGFDPTLGIYWRTDPNAAWQFLAVTGDTFALPVSGGAYLRYASHPLLAPRGELFRTPGNRLPSWMTGYFDPASLFRQTFRPFAFEGELIGQRTREIALSRFLTLAPVGADRVGWVGPALGRGLQGLTVRFVGDDGHRGSARAALSAFDFGTATDPVWWREIATGRILLRNLMVVERVLFAPDGRYTISGENAGLVPDFGIYWRTSTRLPWEWLDPESPGYATPLASGITSAVGFTLPVSGSLLVRYGSQSRLNGLDGDLVLSWLGGETRSFALVLTTPANLFDSYGDLFGLPRLLGEDNLAYKNRLRLVALDPPDPTLPGVMRGLALRTGLLVGLPWDGVTTLAIDAASGVTQVTVVGLDPLREVIQQLSPHPEDPTQFFASYGSWRPGALVLEDGRPVPVLAVSGNIVTLGRPATGIAEASYSFLQYGVTTDASGFITALFPGTGIASGSYVVLLVRRIRAYVPDQPDVQRDRLLSPAGVPNRLFRALAAELAESNPTVFGRARWEQAAWFAQTDQLPPIARLPQSFDLSSVRDEV